MFKPRTTAPAKDNKFYFSNSNIFFRDVGPDPNCTRHAYGRFMEICGERLPIIDKSTGATGNAEDWFDVIKKSSKFCCSDSPRLGAVACWSVGNIRNGKDGAGHVAIVEAIKPNCDIVTSNGAWDGPDFYMETYYASKGYNWTSKKTGKKYIFQGFIYPTTNFWEEECNKITTRGLTLRELPNGSFRCPVKQYTIPKGDIFKYDGKYTALGRVKWVHGSWNGNAGWVPEMYLT